jgi:predicted ATPase with chaperone activity
MTAMQTQQEVDPELLRQILSNDSFLPTEPNSIQETGLSDSFVESLLLKHLNYRGASSGRLLADSVCLPFAIVPPVLESLRSRRLLSHAGSAPLNDYTYLLTESGHEKAQAYIRQCGYAGPAPVPLAEYITSVNAQSISEEAPDRGRLLEACKDISVEPQLFDKLGPALNSCAGMFLYGSPGNGKSTLARHITACFGQHIWVPHAIIESGEIFKFFDSQFHRVVPRAAEGVVRTTLDRRWVQVERPTVVVGGELTLDNLELRFNQSSNVCEAPLQMKSNCGCLLLDDFGRQRVAPADLLNRWIVPLETQHDFLTLPSGKKIQVPFEQLIIFSTNLEPEDLVDEAFLRRIPYKIHMTDPCDEEFHYLFKMYSGKFGCEYRKDVVNYLLETHYKKAGRRKRRCHARDLLLQIRNYCQYNLLELELLPEYFDKAVDTYFTMVLKEK